MADDSNTYKDGIRPDFLGNSKNQKSAEVLKSAESSASFAVSLKTDGIATNIKNVSSSEGISVGEGNGLNLAVMAPFLVISVAIIGIIVFMLGLPLLMIGGIDYNLQKVLGFSDTVGILEEVGEHVTSEYLSNGKVPSEYASDLADNGVMVGQITPMGEFVRTDVYIADIENRNDLVAAASGFSYISEDNGELALLYNDEVISADDFVAKVESDPVLYAAYSKAANISTKFYYGSDVEKAYQDMGISRGNFNEWQATGNYQEDEKSYYEILTGVLNNGSDLTVGGYHNDKKAKNNGADLGTYLTDDYFDMEKFEDSGTFEKDVSDGDGGEITSDLADKTREYVVEWNKTDKMIGGFMVHDFPEPKYSDNATERAAELLNTAVSSGEPYLAANAFIAIEEPIQRARAGDNGPVNQVMNTLTRGTSVTYQDVQTGGNVTTDLSILETRNFRAAVSDSNYSKEEAENFGRDRVLKTTGQANSSQMKEVIQNTTTTSNGKADSSSVVRNGRSDNTADESVISKAKENINLSHAKNNSESFQSVIGGNRIIEGGSFISNTINMKVIGAMPSDEGKITAYHKEVEEVMARKAEAERITKSPFDISSPNTFFGSIMHNLAQATIKNYSNSQTFFSLASVVGSAANSAIANLADTAIATGGNNEYTTMIGNGCETIGTVDVEGDLYCTSHNTPSTKYINYTLNDWKNSPIGGDIDSDGKISEESELEKFVKMGMSRNAAVGVKSAEVCEAYREYNDNVFDSIGNLFKNMAGLYDVCSEDDVPLEVSTGATYTFGANGDSKNEYYSGYVLYNQVRSLLSNEQSAVSILRENYEKTHPEDNSEAGLIAKRSGMTKYEAEIALSYADYLNVIATYDASTRYLFGNLPTVANNNLKFQNDEILFGVYAWHMKETEYNELRNRNFVV